MPKNRVFLQCLGLLVTLGYLLSVYVREKLPFAISIENRRVQTIPTAKRVPTKYLVGNTEFQDDYLWFRNKSDPDVQRYIDQENRYTDSFMRKNKLLLNDIRTELGRETKQLISSCLHLDSVDSLWQDGSFVYYKKTVGRFPVYKRKSRLDSSCGCPLDSLDETILDLNQILPNTTSFLMVGNFQVSQDGSRLAFSLDLVGDERYSLYIYDIDKQLVLHGPIANTYYSGYWKGDYFYYNVVDEQWGVPLSIESFGPIDNPKRIVVYKESDITFTTELYKTSDGEEIFIVVNGQITSELIQIQRNQEQVTLRAIFKRKEGVKYFVEHYQGNLVVMTNNEAPNYKVELHDSTTLERLSTLVVHSESVYLEKIQVFKDYFVLWIRENSFRKLRVYDWASFKSFEYPKVETLPYAIAANMEMDMEAILYSNYETQCILFANSSFLEPMGLYSLNMKTFQISSLIRSIGEVDNEYHQEQIFAKGHDGVRIPLSVVYTKSNTPRPLMLSAYGAYGSFIDPQYQVEIEPFLKRGYIWAVCHPRGDADMGAKWYSDGKMERKMNTFMDVNSCIAHLVSIALVDPNRIALKGRSAGGLVAGNALLGSMFHFRPNVVIAQVPFIDPIYDLIDPTVPWTAFEWSEWGNPHKNEILSAMMEYSPYHNIKVNLTVPKVLVSCGMADPRVPFWEPVKFVAKLRSNAYKKGGGRIYLRVGLNGHFGANEETEMAEWIVFVIKHNA